MIRLGGLLLLGTASLLWMTGPSLAAGHGGGGHGGGGHGGFGGAHGGYAGGHGYGGYAGYGGGWHGAGIGHYGRGWYGGHYGNGWHNHDWYDHGWRNYGWYGGYYPGLYGYGDYPSYDDVYYPSYNYGAYSSQPAYVQDYINTDNVSAPPVVYGSFSTAAPALSDNTARLTVLVPADGRLWFENKPTTETGTRREFVSPPLTPGRSYLYTIRLQFKRNGNEVEETKAVEVRAGSNVTIDFASRPFQLQSPVSTTASGS
jgi:uncharacterized protein (TIGR03000 family)